MKVLRFLALLWLFSATGWPADAQKAYPVFTPDNFINSMKLVGRNFGAVNASLAKNDFDTATVG